MQTFSKTYPHLTWWIENHGWIEIGTDDYSGSWVRILDEGGTYWEDENADNIDEALANGEEFLVTDIPDRFGRDII